LPLAVIGVLAGLLITQQPLSFPSFLGIVGLAGIAVNDAIILIDRINVNRTIYRIPFYEAIMTAGQERLQPIILTTVTTIAGVLPLTLSDPFWAPFGVSLMFGITSATLLTLVIIPAMYVGFERKHAIKAGEQL
jgi:multidrug efflux pump subunit AcrB